MKKFFKKVHLWFALPFGIILINLFGTGALMAFEDEWLRLFSPNQFYVEKVTDNKIPLQILIPEIKKQLPDSIHIESLTVSSASKENYSFGIKGIKHGVIRVDQYSGKIKDINAAPEKRFFRTVRRLHRWLLLPHKKNKISWGRVITGISVFAFLIIIISGIIAWIPKNLKMLKKHLTIKWKVGNFRRWHDYHLVTGIYSAIFLVIFCITGLTWSFNWYKTGFYKLLNAEVQIVKDKKLQNNIPSNNVFDTTINSASYSNSNHIYSIWQNVLNNILNQQNDFSLAEIKDNKVLVAPKGSYNVKIADEYTFNPNTGEITNISLAAERTDKYTIVKKLVYDIHTGKIGGFITKLLMFLACLAGIGLTITGYYMYIKKLSSY